MPPPAWLADPGLRRLWDAARRRLERNHLEPVGRIVLAGLSREERHATGGLLGRALVSERVTVDLAVLDEVLARRSSYRGLADTVAAVTGEPLRDRRAERSAAAAAREEPLALARELLATLPVDFTWSEAWLGGVRRSGLLGRTGDPSEAVRRGVATLNLLLAGDGAVTSRTDLAVQVAGDAHGLDDGTVLAQLVLRALALDSGTELPTSAADRRQLWEEYGVRADSVSTTCLMLGLRAYGDDPRSRRLALAADAGDPAHLTSRDVDGLSLAAPRDVLVCENPRVLEAVADQFGGSVPVVCAAGQPVLVVLDVLKRLAAAGSALHYHGDFDWPGLAIANRLASETGVVPWLMGEADYVAAVRRGPATLELAGTPVTACWDDGLAPAMTTYGAAVHEEAVLDDLIGEIASDGLNRDMSH